MDREANLRLIIKWLHYTTLGCLDRIYTYSSETVIILILSLFNVNHRIYGAMVLFHLLLYKNIDITFSG